MKIGILGGSFNPIHNGHLAMAEAARAAHGLDRVLLVPAARPPHKRDDLAPADDRLEMVRLAVKGRKGLEASAIEVERPGTSYTVDTLEELARRHPVAEIFFILGADSISELPSWKNVPRIFELARVVAVNRPGVSTELRREDFRDVSPARLSRLDLDRVTMPPSPCESRRIREAIQRREALAGQLPPAVEEYILRKGLYSG